MAPFLLVYHHPLLRSTLNKNWCNTFLAIKRSIVSFRDYKERKWKKVQFSFTPTLKQRHLLLTGLSHQSASQGSRWLNEQAPFTVFKQHPIVNCCSAPIPPTPTSSAFHLLVMADLAGKAYGCNKSSSGI